MTGASLSPDLRPAVTLHVGMGKTGSTTIQTWLHHHRARLADLGVLFPQSPGKKRHARVSMALGPERRNSINWRRSEFSGPQQLRPVFERDLLAEIVAARPARLVLSDEGLLAPPEETIVNLRDLLDRIASSVRVVAYLRRQDDHLCSRYQQVVKQGTAVRRLSERADQMADAPLYDYPARLAEWESLMRPDQLVVRRFQRSSFTGGSLLHDFVEAAGLELDVADFAEPPVRNESIDAESIEMLRLLSLHHREQPGPAPDLPRQGVLVRRLQRVSHGPALTLPADRLDRFMDRWEEPNREVARRYFPDGPDVLFENKRRTEGTTTVQRLDPDRVGHFVEVLGLPRELLVPLRQLAEREAMGN